MAKFCINCGNPIEEGYVFCQNCGAKLDSPGSVQPEQPRTQSYGDANNQPPQQPHQESITYQQPQQPHQESRPIQQPQQPHQESRPNQQPAQPYPQYGNQKPPKKNNTALIISLVVAGAVVTTAVVVFLLFFLLKFLFGFGGITPPIGTPSVTENVTEVYTEPETEEPTQKPTQKPAAYLPYTDSLGKIGDYDFAWISDAMSGNLEGSYLSKDELLGKWKGEFIFDGIWELVYVTIDTDGTVTVQPYKINYGDGWEDESGDPSYDFSGSFGINRVYGDGGYGKIDLYEFIESGGTQYGIGQFNTTSGNKAEVYLVRP